MQKLQNVRTIQTEAAKATPTQTQEIEPQPWLYNRRTRAQTPAQPRGLRPFFNLPLSSPKWVAH
jgi:hypothetical protein